MAQLSELPGYEVLPLMPAFELPVHMYSMGAVVPALHAALLPETKSPVVDLVPGLECGSVLYTLLTKQGQTSRYSGHGCMRAEQRDAGKRQVIQRNRRNDVCLLVDGSLEKGVAKYSGNQLRVH